MLTLISNLKGGVGKSTLAFNLAVWLKESRGQAQVYDLDPQKTLTDAIELRREIGYEPDIEVRHDPELLFQHPQLPDCEILVDTGATAFDLVFRIAGIADRIVIPVQPSQADIWATQRFIKNLKSHLPKLPALLAFVNRADTHHAVTETIETEAALRMLPELKPLPCRLCQRTAYRRSFSEGLAVFEMGPLTKAGQEMMTLADAVYPVN